MCFLGDHFIIIIWLTSIIEDSGNHFILVAQDPAFNETDRKLLRDIAGFEVVDSPIGFDLIDENTFLFAPHLEDTFYGMALSKWPTLTFGNDVDVYNISTR